eukprot:1193131-Prorocentrum_minimum.AAC.1
MRPFRATARVLIGPPPGVLPAYSRYIPPHSQVRGGQPGGGGALRGSARPPPPPGAGPVLPGRRIGRPDRHRVAHGRGRRARGPPPEGARGNAPPGAVRARRVPPRPPRVSPPESARSHASLLYDGPACQRAGESEPNTCTNRARPVQPRRVSRALRLVVVHAYLDQPLSSTTGCVRWMLARLAPPAEGCRTVYPKTRIRLGPAQSERKAALSKIPRLGAGG